MKRHLIYIILSTVVTVTSSDLIYVLTVHIKIYAANIKISNKYLSAMFVYTPTHYIQCQFKTLYLL